MATVMDLVALMHQLRPDKQGTQTAQDATLLVAFMSIFDPTANSNRIANYQFRFHRATPVVERLLLDNPLNLWDDGAACASIRLLIWPEKPSCALNTDCTGVQHPPTDLGENLNLFSIKAKMTRHGDTSFTQSSFTQMPAAAYSTKYSVR